MKQQVNTLNLTDTDGILASYSVNESVASKVKAEFARKIATIRTRGSSLEFTHFILSTDNVPVAEELLCIPVDKIKSLGIRRPIRRAGMSVKATGIGNGTVSYYAKRTGKRRGGFSSAIDYLVKHPKLLSNSNQNAADVGLKMHKTWKVSKHTAAQYVYNIRAMHRRGELK